MSQTGHTNSTKNVKLNDNGAAQRNIAVIVQYYWCQLEQMRDYILYMLSCSHFEQLRDVRWPGGQDVLHADMPHRNDNGCFGTLSNQSAHTPLPSGHSILKVDFTWGSKGKCNVKACGGEWGMWCPSVWCVSGYTYVHMYIHAGNVNEWDWIWCVRMSTCLVYECVHVSVCACVWVHVCTYVPSGNTCTQAPMSSFDKRKSIPFWYTPSPRTTGTIWKHQPHITTIQLTYLHILAAIPKPHKVLHSWNTQQ